ncbi:acetyl-CoA carboxylase carboxyltransferase subunit alpha [Phosphitispora fastidiosa]|uniref:acetyl-CoA carboxylase carboxyltransferase subunit alpha n=1 Tax=Phosphitispora fastidiosa TaxID=2837202 RepID=UPI001E439186|nr:acetyl-CoA carboxylase carboxyltransferase subunit alpha [Phosphitispora fastidiosa]MBU7008352.1 acetyl-CoA carboxylase carboxyl transferase subunit alpha [Phosphitispora fastidiosa]
MPSIMLEFEKPISELEAKIEELKNFSSEQGIDLAEEIKIMQAKAEALKKEIFGKLTPVQRVTIARHPERPGTLEYIKHIFEEFIELHGDRYFGDDRAVIGGIARFRGVPVTVIGHAKGKDTKENLARNFGMPNPEGNRKALRLMEQAEKFGRPVFTFVDTPGAHCGMGAEERGQARAIAVNLTRLMQLRVPVINTIIGEGGSGGALAIAVGDRLMMLENSVFSVISPESFASILWKDPTRAQEAVGAMKMTAYDLAELGIIDEIVPEPLGGAHRNPKEIAARLGDNLKKNLDSLKEMPVAEMLQKRYEKFRGIGQFISG